MAGLLVLLVPDPGPPRRRRVPLGVRGTDLAADAEPDEHEADGHREPPLVRVRQVRAQGPVGRPQRPGPGRSAAVGNGLRLEQHVARQHRDRPQLPPPPRDRSRLATCPGGSSRPREASPRRTHPVTVTGPAGAGATSGRTLAPASDGGTQPRSTTTSGPPASGRSAHSTSRPVSPSRVRLRTKTGPPAYRPVTVTRVHSSARARGAPGVSTSGQRDRGGAVVRVEPLVARGLRLVAVVLPPTEVVAGDGDERGEEEGAQPARSEEPPEHVVTVPVVHWTPMADLPAPRLLDQFGRVGRDLRVSVTDRCNLRCTLLHAGGGPGLAAQARDAHRRRARAPRRRHGGPRHHAGAAHRWRAPAAPQPRRRRRVASRPSSPGRASR